VEKGGVRMTEHRRRDRRYALKVWLSGSDTKIVSSWHEASMAVLKWIGRHGVQYDGWHGGEIRRTRDNHRVASVSYEGIVTRAGEVLYTPGDPRRVPPEIPVNDGFHIVPTCPVCGATPRDYLQHYARHHLS
jgi:hypothetical protein